VNNNLVVPASMDLCLSTNLCFKALSDTDQLDNFMHFSTESENQFQLQKVIYFIFRLSLLILLIYKFGNIGCRSNRTVKKEQQHVEERVPRFLLVSAPRSLGVECVCEIMESSNVP
jgi:hypothetical protein